MDISTRCTTVPRHVSRKSRRNRYTRHWSHLGHPRSSEFAKGDDSELLKAIEWIHTAGVEFKNRPINREVTPSFPASGGRLMLGFASIIIAVTNCFYLIFYWVGQFKQETANRKPSSQKDFLIYALGRRPLIG